MSAAEDDTELRDLLLQNLENSGVLSRLKAQMRAAVFLAMEEQDQLENKAPLVNENLKNCLNTRDGRVVASLVLDFLQVFDLDFSRSVFEPEISAKQLESRDLLCKDLDLNPNPKSPLLLELVQRHHQHRTKDRTKDWTKDQGPSEKQLEWVRQRFDFYDRDGAGSINKDDAKRVFFDLFPKMNRHVLEQFVLEELRDRAVSTECEWKTFQLLYQSLFSFSSSVVESCGQDQDSEERPSAPHRQGFETKGVSGLDPGLTRDPGLDSGLNPDPQRDLDLDHVDDGDSFFDDPLPAPQKTYGCSEDSGPVLVLRRDKSLSDLSILAASTEVRKPESPIPSLSLGRSSSSEPSHTGASKAKGPKDSRPLSGRSGSHRLDEDVEYDDDFNSELSIGEEIEEVSIEGPEPSDKFDEMTQDLSVSQLSHTADYMEEVP
ncbi:hypothetical protein NQD34_017588 [Periophthalmus magnuspinnatus]|nr:hypothetical protein NQD34_017588 [Periophthalmus magnuspinnatus]